MKNISVDAQVIVDRIQHYRQIPLEAHAVDLTAVILGGLLRGLNPVDIAHEVIAILESYKNRLNLKDLEAATRPETRH